MFSVRRMPEGFYPNPGSIPGSSPLNISTNISILPMRSDYHVTPFGKLWAIKQEHRAHHWGLYLTKAEAIGEGITQARLGAVSLVVHGRDGRVQKVWSYDKAIIPYR